MNDGMGNGTCRAAATNALTSGEVDLLRNSTLFSTLSDPDLDILLAEASIQTIERSTTLFMQGDSAEAFFLVLDGWMKVYRMTPGGDEAVVGIFTRGQSFAEAAAFTGGIYPASGEAVTPCRLLRVSARRLFDCISRSPGIGLAMLASTSRHLHVLVQQIEQLKAHTGAQRVAEFLVALAPVEEGPCTIALPYDKALIAGRLGMKPESLSRAFQRLKVCGLTVDHNFAIVSEIAQLRDFVERERSEVLRGASGS